MTGRPSAAMQKAMKHIMAGCSPAQAAKKAGVSRSTISRSALYRDWLKKQEQPK